MATEGERADQVSRRKLEHLELALNGNVDGPNGAWWDDVWLIHDCLPEIDLADVDLSTSFLGQELHAPLWIAGMTGGHERAAELNARLARASQRHGIAMGLGSQRAGLAAERLMDTYRIARQAAPEAVLVANIGAPQLVPQQGSPALTLEDVGRLIEALDAQGLAIHLNALQEMVQPEGDRNARGVLSAIQRVIRAIGVPVLMKETGAGISRERAHDLVDAGVAAIDVGGAGGTSMARIEGARGSDATGQPSSLSHALDGWGIPTAASILEARGCGVPIIATGGVRSGLDAARAIALGAQAVGVGRPFLSAANEGEEALDAAIGEFLRELRAALFLSGCATPDELRLRGAVILGNLRSWAEQRGLNSPFVSSVASPVPTNT